MASYGAEYLQSIYGTEKDKVNCPFYFKIGACRHGDKCERRHNKPTLSQTLLLSHMYANPVITNPRVDPKQVQEEFEDFYEDIHEELSKYGEIEELHVCENINDHMVGNVYCKYYREESAEKALRALTGRFYSGRPVVAEFSPVTDFREASCRQFEMNECNRGGHCNFMHLKQVSRDLYRYLFGRQRKRRSRSRSREKPRRRSRERSRERHQDRDRFRHNDRDRYDRERRDDRGRDQFDREDKRRKFGGPPFDQGVQN